jgi:hypothetical protein
MNDLGLILLLMLFYLAGGFYAMGPEEEPQWR